MGIITDNTEQKKELMNWKITHGKIARMCTETQMYKTLKRV